MSELDDKLARWRRETERVEPSAALLARLTALASAPAPTAAPAAGAAAAVAPKTALWLMAVGLLGVAGALVVAFLSREGGVLSQREAPAPSADVAVAPSAPKVPEAEPVRVPALPAGVAGAPPAASAAPAPVAVLLPRPEPIPALLAEATAALPLNCFAQRNVLIELIGDHVHDDPHAAAAGLARWTLLCRSVSGPPVDTHHWFWPWGLALSGAGSSCKTVMSDPGCEIGPTVTSSIEGAAGCLAATTPGSCARRASRLQAVFAACELQVHRPSPAHLAAVTEALGGLTSEFGAGLAGAAWCLDPAASTEGARVRRLGPGGR